MKPATSFTGVSIFFLLMSLILDTMFERYFILSFLKSIVVGGQRLQAVAPPPADDDAEEHVEERG